MKRMTVRTWATKQPCTKSNKSRLFDCVTKVCWYHVLAPPLKVFIPETSSSTDVRVSSVHLPDSSSVAQSTSVSSVSTVTQSVLVSESPRMMVHSSAVSEGAMMVSDSTASTSSDLGSAIDKIIESTIGPDIMNGISTETPLSIIS